MKLWNYPNINDVTTTPEDAPVFETLARRDPDTFSSRVKLLYGETLEPLDAPLDPDELFLKVETAAETTGWKLERIDRERRQLEAVAITATLRFRDDIVIEVRETENGAQVHMRSRSRLGRKDFGVNERRIRDFLDRVREKL